MFGSEAVRSDSSLVVKFDLHKGGRKGNELNQEFKTEKDLSK